LVKAAERLGVLDDAADEVQGHLAQPAYSSPAKRGLPPFHID
jgi:hypothetical protein